MYSIDSNNDAWLKNTQLNIKTNDWLNLRARKGLQTEYEKKIMVINSGGKLSPTITKTAWKMLSIKEYSSIKPKKSK
mgnify:CR=1 FL=1